MVFRDNELGDIIVRENIRSRNITVRYKDGQFHLSHPPYTTKATIERSIRELKPKLIALKAKVPLGKKINEKNPFCTFCFTTEISQNSLTRYYTRLKDRILYITYPKDIDCNSEDSQKTIRTLIEKTMRAEANRILSVKVEYFAKKYNFKYIDLSINKSRTRWGSCSAKKKINLSYYCLLLPEHLVDFVILHELCHTVEMNHGVDFWNLLDSVSSNRSKQLTQELKNYRTSW